MAKCIESMLGAILFRSMPYSKPSRGFWNVEVQPAGHVACTRLVSLKSKRDVLVSLLGKTVYTYSKSCIGCYLPVVTD